MVSLTYILVFTSLLSIVLCHLLVKRHIDFIDRFMERRKERQIRDERIKLLDKYALKNTESVDGILHYKLGDSTYAKSKKMKAIETDFRRLIDMQGVKYNYKRDLYWRTWRKVLSDDGIQEFVCYKCNNPIHSNASECQNCGMWTIEEGSPPCPYEFFSVINDQQLCGAHYTQYRDLNSTCPSVIKFSDLTATCDNPIETIWRFIKLYGATEEYENIICPEEDYCDIFTQYEIAPQQVIFRIINSSNDVIYSRVMKPNNTNYFCVEDCGRLNPGTGKVSKYDRPLKFSLRINKRENKWNKASDEINRSENEYLDVKHSAYRQRQTDQSLAFDRQTEAGMEKNKMSVSKNGGEKGTKKRIKSEVKKRQQSAKEYRIPDLETTEDSFAPQRTTVRSKKIKKSEENDASYSEQEYI